MRTHRLALLLAATLGLAPAAARAQESALAELRAAPASADARLRLGRALRRAGRFDEAVRALQGAATGPTRADALWEIARVRFDQGVFQPARSACMALPAPRGTGPEALRRRVCLARAYLLWNRVALAEREINAARAVNPNDPELLLVIADSRRLASDIQGAEAAYRAAESALPSHRNDAALGLAQLYEMFQRLEPAQAQYARALQIDPSDPTAALLMGRFLLKRRELPAEAVAHLRRATEERPRWAEALVSYGDALLATGANEDALRAFQGAAELSATQPGAQSGLGRALVALGRHADAEAPLRLAIQQVGTDVAAHMALAEVLERTGRESDAVQSWNDAIDRAPGNLTPRLRAAQLLHRTHQNALARAYLDRVLTDDPALAPALYLRGVIAHEEGDRAAARQSLTDALRGHGEFDRADAQRRLQEIDAPQRTRRR